MIPVKKPHGCMYKDGRHSATYGSYQIQGLVPGGHPDPFTSGAELLTSHQVRGIGLKGHASRRSVDFATSITVVVETTDITGAGTFRYLIGVDEDATTSGERCALRSHRKPIKEGHSHEWVIIRTA